MHWDSLQKLVGLYYAVRGKVHTVQSKLLLCIHFIGQYQYSVSPSIWVVNTIINDVLSSTAKITLLLVNMCVGQRQLHPSFAPRVSALCSYIYWTNITGSPTRKNVCFINKSNAFMQSLVKIKTNTYVPNERFNRANLMFQTPLAWGLLHQSKFHHDIPTQTTSV